MANEPPCWILDKNYYENGKYTVDMSRCDPRVCTVLCPYQTLQLFSALAEPNKRSDVCDCHKFPHLPTCAVFQFEIQEENCFRKCAGLPTLIAFIIDFVMPDSKSKAQQIVDGVGDCYFLIVKKVPKRVQEFFIRNSECVEILVGEDEAT